MANTVKIPAIVQRKESDSGGGVLGSILGGAAAILAAPFTGGASLGFAGTAMTAGGLAGGVIDKAEAGGSSATQVPAQSTDAQSAIARKFANESGQNAQSSPQVSENIQKANSDLKTLAESVHALAKAPPEVQQQYAPVIMPAFRQALSQGRVA